MRRARPPPRHCRESGCACALRRRRRHCRRRHSRRRRGRRHPRGAKCAPRRGLEAARAAAAGGQQVRAVPGTKKLLVPTPLPGLVELLGSLPWSGPRLEGGPGDYSQCF